jgi:hypothetical protein
MTKYLLEFHGAAPSRETLEMAVSTGNLELIKMMRERLPESVLEDRLELMEIASECHHGEVLIWLLRDASLLDGQLLWTFALEEKLADALLASMEAGHGPWWHGVRELSQEWRASSELELVAAPEGFSLEGGWWRSKSGEEFPLAPLNSGGAGVWILPKSVKREDLIGVALPSGVTTIGKKGLRDCSGLAVLKIPSGVTTIGYAAFFRCSGLTRVEIPPSVMAIGDAAFLGCSNLTQLEIPRSVTTIEPFVFSDCSNLTQLEIPPSVCRIGARAFWLCSNLTELHLPPSLRAIDSFAFDGCSGVTQLEIPLGVRWIGSAAFSGCSGLTQLQIPPGVRTIESCVFSGCSGLRHREV